METWNTYNLFQKNLLLYLSQGMHIMNGAKIIPKYKRLRNRIIHEHWALEWPMLWRITKNSLHNEGTYKWVNWAPIFFDSNYFQLLRVLSSLQKSAFSKLIILFFQYFWCQNWNQGHNLSGKNTHIFFFYFWFKNKRVWAEKIRKKRKNFNILKVSGNYPNIKFTLVF